MFDCPLRHWRFPLDILNWKQGSGNELQRPNENHGGCFTRVEVPVREKGGWLQVKRRKEMGEIAKFFREVEAMTRILKIDVRIAIFQSGGINVQIVLIQIDWWLPIRIKIDALMQIERINWIVLYVNCRVFRQIQQLLYERE